MCICFPGAMPNISFQFIFVLGGLVNLLWLYSNCVKMFLRSSIGRPWKSIWCNVPDDQ